MGVGVGEWESIDARGIVSCWDSYRERSEWLYWECLLVSRSCGCGDDSRILLIRGFILMCEVSVESWD